MSGRAPPSAHDDLGEPDHHPRVLGDEIGAQLARARHRRGEADGDEPRPQGPEPREVERQEIAALGAASACSSSRIAVSRPAKRCGASGWLKSSASCSGVVIRMCGGRTRWRWRRATEVSPVRVSVRIGRPISAMGAVRLRATSTASALSGEM